MSKLTENPLGRDTDFPDTYDSGLLYTLPRAAGRETIGIGSDAPLPFQGVDRWTAWELSWLGSGGRPVVAVLRCDVPATSPRLIESKSLKLYLNSFAMTRIDSVAEVAARIAADLGQAAGAEVDVRVTTATDCATDDIGRLPGHCIDDEDMAEAKGGPRYVLDPTLLSHVSAVVSEKLHSHLLRSLCPVTAQPDTGSILIDYRGPRIDRGALLAYLVSYRQHQEFHEQCVERIFRDLSQHCGARKLTVYACYNRRGGIDINPFRSNVAERPPALRLWRQ